MAIKETLKQRTAKFDAGINTRGQAKIDKKNKKDTSKPAISPTLVALLVFIICGSAIIGLLQTLLSTYLTPSPSFELTPEMLAAYQAQQEVQQGFGSLADFPLNADLVNAEAELQNEVVNLDDVVQNQENEAIENEN